jgi:hypothetical protein
MEFQSANPAALTDDDIAAAATTLGCDPAAVRAVSAVEAPRGGFLPAPDRRPVILFESHAFHWATGGRFDASHPGISTHAWVHNYGPGGAHQYERLDEAIALDRAAALKSASWGKYQIMGGNFYEAGYDTVEAFVADMAECERYQLDAFVCFLQNTGIDAALRAHDWAAFARRYNGPGQVAAYAARIVGADREAEEYERQIAAAHAAAAAPAAGA